MKKRLQSLLQLMLLVTFLSGSFVSYGQVKPDKKPVPQVALEHIQKNRQKLELEESDIAELELSSDAESKKSGVKHYYLKQFYQGIEIHGAVSNISVSKDNKVITMGDRFQKSVGKKVKTSQAQLDAAGAVAAAARHLNTSIKEPLTVIEKSNGRNKEMLFSRGGISLEPIPAKLVFQPMEDGSLRLAWEVSVYELNAQNWWNLRVDANTGKVLDKDNMVVHCQFDNDGPDGVALHTNHSHSRASVPYSAEYLAAAANTDPFTRNYYNIYDAPVESPSHGNRSLVNSSVAHAVASPNGWHKAGLFSYTTTQGNNVQAYEDPDNNNNLVGLNYSPDGGADLKFDYAIDFTKQPVEYRDAAITNLFYWNNLIHDVWYQYGFDEASGNFQADNFGRGGSGNDNVNAEAQDSRNIATTRNNANFATPADGSKPRMQMYLWSGKPDPEAFTVISPSAIAGSYPAAGASFGPKLSSTPITGKLVLAQDGVSNEGCKAFTNADEIKGNIAIVYRGSCPFVDKVQNAQAAGAIAVVVINNISGAPTSMGGTPTQTITIPSVMVADVTGARIREQLDAKVDVVVSLKDSGSPELDGDFDNGIIVHEYGHGISNRLTGGRTVVNCLNNAEQAGEGWSDWFGLMMTIKPGDSRAMRRGIGTYAQGQPANGRGIRPAPYSTSFGENNFTYAATNNASISQPHGIGFVFATMLWDMTWDLIDKYGFDEDLYNGKGGNNMAMQLVVDGLKLQNCRPGFVDARNAILLADQLNYNGANQELIWRAFARRGLGYSASQGSNTDRFDQVEAFDLPPVYACEKPVITVKPTSDVFTGGSPSTIYLGYGAQSVELQASGSDNYTWSPAAGLNNANIANPVFTPTTAGTYTFTVTGKTNAGCTKYSSVTITVVDVRCGSKNDMVYICHNGQVQCVAPSAVADHLSHGDKLGACGLNQSASSEAVAASGVDKLGADDFVSSYPNPFTESTTISFKAKESGPTVLKVYDVTGREVATLFEGNAESGVTYNNSFKASDKKAGIYIYKIVNGSTSRSGTMVLIK